MDDSAFAGHGYLLIGGLILVGAGLVIVSLIVNAQVAHSVLHDQRHREKVFEYYRNTFSQIGVVLIGIGISLFIFFFQQNYKDKHDREVEVRQILAKVAMRVGRAAPALESLSEFDEILDEGGPYVSPEVGGANHAVTAKGADLANQVNQLLFAERDVDIQQVDVLNFSRDFESSFVVNELDPRLWFNIARDESYVKYAATQLAEDFKDLHAAIGDEPVELAVTKPDKEQKIKHEVLDILYDADLLRDRSRRILGRACWLLSGGQGFVGLQAIDEIEADYNSHGEWLDHAKRVYGGVVANKEDCFKLLFSRPNAQD
jgi:hypothetical protein